MPAKTLIVSEANLGARAVELLSLAKLVKENNKVANEAKAALDKNKKRLAEVSLDEFKTDLSKEIPEVYGNFEYPTEAGTVSVNLKVASAQSPEKIDDKPATLVLRRTFGESVDQLFDFVDTYKLKADEDAMKEQIKLRPDLFGISLKNELSPDQRKTLVARYPSQFNICVTDPEAYAKAFPDSVAIKQVPCFKNGFLEALGKVDDQVKRNARDLIEAILPEIVTPAVSCGK